FFSMSALLIYEMIMLNNAAKLVDFMLVAKELCGGCIGSCNRCILILQGGKNAVILHRKWARKPFHLFGK
ncbi:MAG: hypothetical protein J6R73_03160, partial [Alistipes sp.]|nr:hypothetical protein [Alistipes sp.]